MGQRRDGAGGLGRRTVIGMLGAAMLAGPSAAGADEIPIGRVEAVAGEAFARLTSTRRLAALTTILLGDFVWTAPEARARLGLDGGTTVNLGPTARLKIDRFVAEAGGTLVLGEGALVFDRPDDRPKLDLTVRTAFGLIGVRGTRFFAGPSRGRFGVFVERGEIAFQAAGVERRVGPGEGVDVIAPGEEPGPVTRWGAARIEEALRGVIG